MATSEADVCNRALGRIGQTQFITSLDDASAIARVANAYYADSRDAVLEALPWTFAMRRQTLAALADVTRDGWQFCYSVPYDYLAARFIYNPTITGGVSGDGSLVGEPSTLFGAFPLVVPFDIESDPNAGTIILTNQESAEFVYTAQITQVTKFSPLFVDALAWLLASDFALAIMKKPNVAQAMLQKYEMALFRAGAANARQTKRHHRPRSKFERNR